MRDQRFNDLPADRHQRIERGARLLEDHRHDVAADRRHSGLIQGCDVASVKFDRAATPARDRWQQAHDGPRGQALAATALADQRQRLAAPIVKLMRSTTGASPIVTRRSLTLSSGHAHS